jgi:hypothetical protein
MNVENIEKIVEVAKVCHQANKAWCELNNDNSQVDWELAPDSIRESAVRGVIFALENPNATPKQQHESWMKDKVEDGWVLGEVKDAVKKTHPCIVPYHQLPAFQRKKDELFQNIVKALK